MSSDKKPVVIPNYVLEAYGCRSCVWKSIGQCPHGLSGKEIYGLGKYAHKEGDVDSDGNPLPDFYCIEFATFLLSLASPGDSVSMVKEKFMLYTQEVQAMADHTKFHELSRRYDELDADPGSDKKELGELKVAIEGYKLWWVRLTDSVVKGLGKISDRESRSKDTDKTVQVLSVSQLNKALANSARVLELESSKGDE